MINSKSKNMKNLKIVIIALAFIGTTAYAEEDLCNNIEGMQTTYPSGYSSVGSPGTCYILPEPVTIDVNPVGSGVDAVTIDVNPAGSGVDAVQIDVNPTPSSNTGVIQNSVTTATSTTKVITSTEELQTYLFDPKVPVAERAAVIEERIKAAMIQLIEILTKQLNELMAAQITG